MLMLGFKLWLRDRPHIADALVIYCYFVCFIWIYVLIRFASNMYARWLQGPTGAMDSALDF